MFSGSRYIFSFVKSADLGSCSNFNLSSLLEIYALSSFSLDLEVEGNARSSNLLLLSIDEKLISKKVARFVLAFDTGILHGRYVDAKEPTRFLLQSPIEKSRERKIDARRIESCSILDFSSDTLAEFPLSPFRLLI